MIDYSAQIEAFRDKRVRLSGQFKDKLLTHRASNRKRLISRLPDHISKVSIGESNFKPQGSVAMGTVIQTKFKDEEYDIDDGLVISRSQLKNDDGDELTSDEVREIVRNTLKDKRFNRQPKLFMNCVRVYYADTDAEKHHVDFPVYRRFKNDDGDTIREVASEGKWIQSDPTQVNSWFNSIVEDRNSESGGWGTQFRHLVQLMKRYCRSRKDWLDLLPNGMKLTMLIAECQPDYDERIDIVFRELLKNLKKRLNDSKVIKNLAHPDQPWLTRSANDENVVELLAKINTALSELDDLDELESDDQAGARRVWEWVFKSEGFFKEYDDAVKVSKTASATGSHHSLSRFNVPWCDKPVWPVVKSYSAWMTGRWSRFGSGGIWNNFESDSDPLGKNLHLRFKGHTDCPPPYSVFWQVVNTGVEALNVGQLRGEIVAATSTGAGGLHSSTAEGISRYETTAYAGMHWVQCYIVKDGCCVARSEPFVVNIG